MGLQYCAWCIRVCRLYELQLWECGIEQCKELASQLESVAFNYEKLSEIHVSVVYYFENNVLVCAYKTYSKQSHDSTQIL